MDLQTPIQDISWQLKRYSSRLEKLGITTLEDLLWHIPFRYDDLSLISPIEKLQEGETVTIHGKIKEIKNQYLRLGKSIQQAIVEDNTGTVSTTWFNQPFIPKILKLDTPVAISGKVTFFKGKKIIQSPEYEPLTQETIHTGRLVPVYPQTNGVSSKWLRRQIYQLLKEKKFKIHDYLPQTTKAAHNLIPLENALWNIHFPKDLQGVESAKERLAFDEMLLMQLETQRRKALWQKQRVGHPLTITAYKKEISMFYNKLPFSLTQAQEQAIKEIFADLSKTNPMNRLLQGDVGSGKTIVAAIAMYVSYLNGFQSVLMAPTEILAEQHFYTINSLLNPLDVSVGLATSNKKFRVKNSEFRILVGTHAVLSEKIEFNELGLVVIDEQQRFGVEQRAIIKQKGDSPHLLTMTATPIPRTVALTRYGDLSLSYLYQMPKGRKVVKTWLVPENKRQNAYEWIKKQIETTAHQAFIVCPFIEPSENLQTVKAAKKEFDFLQKSVFSNLKLGLLHGKLSVKEKQNVLNSFRKNDIHILVATPVVEVGIDFPNATIIVIEEAQRFGLAQLHQLRGRVGRGDNQSYCILFADTKGANTTKRLKALESMHEGAKLAQLDLELRGPGEIYGTSQHGVPELKLAQFSNSELIAKTQREAEKLFNQIEYHPELAEKLEKTYKKNIAQD